MISNVNGMQGSEFQIRFELKTESEGTPIDLTGARVKSVLKFAIEDDDEDAIATKTTDENGGIIIKDALHGYGVAYYRSEDTEGLRVSGTRNVYTQLCATLASGQVIKSPNAMIVLEECCIKKPLPLII